MQHHIEISIIYLNLQDFYYLFILKKNKKKIKKHKEKN